MVVRAFEARDVGPACALTNHFIEKTAVHFGYSPQTQSLRVTVEAAIRLYTSLADWADWAQTVPPAAPSTDH